MKTRLLPQTIIALSLLAGITFGAPPSLAAAVGDLQLDIPGDGLGFRSGPFDPLLLTNNLAPGDSATAVVGVRWSGDSLRAPQSRNDGGPAGDLTLRFLQILDLETDCSLAEAPVDPTCGTGPGELGEDVRIDITVDLDDDADHDEFVSSLFTGTVADLADGIGLGGAIADGEEWFFRLTAELPLSSGNETMTDSLAFDLEWQMAGDTEVVPGNEPELPEAPSVDDEGEPVATPQASKPGTDTLGLELTAPADPGPASAPSGLPLTGLPFTGPAGLLEATTAGLALLLVGLAARRTSRRRGVRSQP